MAWRLRSVFEVPSPSNARKAAHPAPQSHDTEAKENTTLDKMRQAVEDVFSVLYQVSLPGERIKRGQGLRIFQPL
jgi:hypothetical protein